MKSEKITLFYRQDKSDKIYKASLEESDGGFLVNFAYGRRGATLRTGTKTQKVVDYEKAKKIFDKLVLSKSSKGYVPDEDNSDYVYESDQIKTGIHCQLLNPIDEDTLQQLFNDDNWIMQEKMDGRRLLIKKTTTEIIAINRKGLSIGVPKDVIDCANKLAQTFIMDGEAIDSNLYVFDLLSIDGQDLQLTPYSERFQKLQNLISTLGESSHIKIVSIAKKSEKKILHDTLKKANAEGVVFKKEKSFYKAGRPNSGGDQVKFKFYDTASVIVQKVNDKRSVGMCLLENGKEIFVGNVTISVNKEIPKQGDIIEVRYLYAYKGGSLYQPTLLNLRTDIDCTECLLSQLKFKAE